MEPNLLETEPVPGVAWLALNRPAHRNALDGALVAALHEALLRHGARPATRVVVLAASGGAFCAGADLPAMGALGRGPWQSNLEDALGLARLLLALRHCSRPTLAVVHGAAIGGGVGLTAACDLAIGSSAAHFRLPEVRLGLVPALISPYVLEAIGARQARRYCLSGEAITAERARELGLLHEVVAPAALTEAALSLASELAQGAPGALAECKQLLADVGHRGPNEALAAGAAERLARLRAGAEAQEGITAAAARRAPGWRS